MNSSGYENKNENFLIDYKIDEIEEKFNEVEANIIEFEESNINNINLIETNMEFEANFEEKEGNKSKEKNEEIENEIEIESDSNLNSCQLSKKSNEKQIISFEENDVSRSMSIDLKYINENLIRINNEKLNPNLDPNREYEYQNSEDENSLLLNDHQEIFEAETEEFTQKIFYPKKTLSKINLNKFDSDYSNNHSIAYDIENIPSSNVIKSNFFSQIKKKSEENNDFIPKNFNDSNNNNNTDNIISLFDDNSKKFSIQDQLISFNSDLEGYMDSNNTLQNLSLSRNSNFNKQNNNRTSFSSFKSNKIFSNFSNTNYSNINSNSSYNLNSTNQSMKKSSQFLQENFKIKEKDRGKDINQNKFTNTNLSNLVYKKYLKIKIFYYLIK
jgi:hypothetical protein